MKSEDYVKKATLTNRQGGFFGSLQNANHW